MLTRDNRGGLADFARKTRRYPSDLTDAECDWIAPHLLKPPPRGRKPAVNFLEILSAIQYMAGRAGGWRMLPSKLGPWQTVYWWSRRIVRQLLFGTIHDVALIFDREQPDCEQVRREAGPGGVLDGERSRRPSPSSAETMVPKRSWAANGTSPSIRPGDVSDSADAQLMVASALVVEIG